MAHDPGAILRAAWSSLASCDLPAILAHFADDVSFAIFIPQDTLPFGGGPTIGKAAMSDRLKSVHDQFWIIRYEGRLSGVLGDTARGQVDYIFRHKSTGEEIDSAMRHVVVVREGLIVRLEEYHDVERLQAFMRLVAHVAARQPD